MADGVAVQLEETVAVELFVEVKDGVLDEVAVGVRVAVGVPVAVAVRVEVAVKVEVEVLAEYSLKSM